MLSTLNAVFKAAKLGETAADPASSSQHEAPEFISRSYCSNSAQVAETARLFE
jgi:hypothetical protein